MRAFQLWWRRATTAERAALEAATGLTQQFFRRMVSDQPGYSRVASSHSAALIEGAANAIRANAPDGARRLPELSRADLSPTCATCSYAQQCLRNRPALLDLDIVPPTN